MKALVVHPRFSVLGGGEYVCLNVLRALNEKGYEVSLLTTDYDDRRIREAFDFPVNIDVREMLDLPRFEPILSRGLAAQRAVHARIVRTLTRNLYKNFDLIFHTQTAYFLGPPMRITLNVFYDPSDVFLIDLFSGHANPFMQSWKKPYYWMLRTFIHNRADVEKAYNIPLSQMLEDHLAKHGFRHSRYVYPPCDMRFLPSAKKKRIVQATRIVPHKRLESFMEIARRLPQYEFMIVGSVSETEKKLHPHYAERLLSERPGNVTYVQTRIRNSPELIEESQVYLYTSEEPGINISTAQAVGAGCIPVTPAWGGGAEIVKETRMGYSFETIDQACQAVEKAMENPEWSSQDLRYAARRFSDESFRTALKNIVDTLRTA